MKKREHKLISIIVILVILLIGTNIKLIFNQNTVLTNGRQIIKEMDESEQISSLNSTINELNKAHDEYQAYIQECKAKLASAVTEKGVSTTENHGLEEIVNNIKNINDIKDSEFNIYLLSAYTYTGFVSNVTYDVSNYNILEFTTQPNMLNIYGDGQLIRSVSNTTESIDISQYKTITFKGELSPSSAHGTIVQGTFKK